MPAQVTPLNSDLYSRTMARAFDERDIIKANTGFQAFFGRGGGQGETLFSPDANLVEIDIVRGNRRIAVMIERGEGGRSTSKPETTSVKFTNFSRGYPLMEEVGSIHANQINNRMVGENPFNMTPSKRFRLQELAVKEHKEHVRRMSRTSEVLASQSIRTGIMDSIVGTLKTDLQYNFHRNAANSITVATGWNQASPTIMANIDNGCDKIKENGNVIPHGIVIGTDAFGFFLEDTALLAKADNRRFDQIEVNSNPVPNQFQRFVDAGFTPRGRLQTPGGYTLWMFTYVNSYINSGGTDTKYMPVDEALIFSLDSRCDRYFGPSEILPLSSQRLMWVREMLGFDLTGLPEPLNVEGPRGIISPAAFYNDAYPSEDGKSVTIRTQYAPIYAPITTDGFALLEGLIT